MSNKLLTKKLLKNLFFTQLVSKLKSIHIRLGIKSLLTSNQLFIKLCFVLKLILKTF